MSRKKAPRKWIVNLEQWVESGVGEGDGPFHSGSKIDVIRRNGTVEYNIPCGSSKHNTGAARFLVLDDYCGDLDVLLYRLHDPSDIPAPKKVSRKQTLAEVERSRPNGDEIPEPGVLYLSKRLAGTWVLTASNEKMVYATRRFRLSDYRLILTIAVVLLVIGFVVL